MAKAKKVEKKAPAKKAAPAKAPAKKAVKAEKPKKVEKAAKPAKKAEKKDLVKKPAKKVAEKPAKKVEPVKKAAAKPAKIEKSKKVEKAKNIKPLEKPADKKPSKETSKEPKKEATSEALKGLASKSAKKSDSKAADSKKQVTPADSIDASEFEGDDHPAESKSAKKGSSKAPKKSAREEIDLPEMDDDFGGGEDFGGFEEEVPPAKKSKAVVIDDKNDVSSEIILTDAEGRRLCKVPNCDQVSTVEGYCRYHYLLFWKRIQVRKKILSEGKLDKYIEELTSRYPMKYLEMLRKDLRSHQDFLSAIQELEIDDSSSENEFEDEAQNFIDEVRGISGTEGESDDEY